MTNTLIAWWARNPVAANFLMAAILLGGLFSFNAMEREVWPTFRVNWVEVVVPWPGAAPQEVEEQIILRVEESLKDLENIQRLRATAAEGAAFIYIETDPRIDVKDFINDVKLRVDSISNLPSDIDSPRVREILTRNELIRVVIHGEADEKLLTRTAQKVRDEMSSLPYVSLVNLFGARDEEVTIELSEQAMQRYGLGFDEVARAIRSSSVNLSSGSVRTETGYVQIRARNLADNRQDFENIIVRQTDDGAIIRVRDVARVIDGFEEFNILATFNGEPAILVQVMTGERMNVVKTSEAVREWLASAKDTLPPGIKASLWTDESKVYFDRMETVGSSAAIGLILVLIVLFLFLHPKVATWVTIGIATAFAGAFIFLPGQDISLNMLSLFAFLLVIGVVVDDAIIVGESIHSHVEEGERGVRAAILGTQMVAKPVTYAVLTTMIAFSPWLFLSGIQVEFTRQIPIIVIAALTFSLIEAFFILPAHLRKLRPVPEDTRNPFMRMQRRIAGGLVAFAQNVYRPAARFCVDQRYFTFSVFVFFLAVAVGLMATGRLPMAFMPEIEAEEVSVNVDMPDGTPYERALQVLRQLQRAEKQLEVEVNQAGSKLIDNWYTRAREDSVLAIVKLVPPEERDLSAKEAAERLRALIGDVPDAEEINVSYTINDSDTGISFAVNHRDLGVLRAAVDDLKAQLRTYAAAYDVSDNLRAASDEIRLQLKPGAEKLGLTLREVSRQVRQAYYGEEVQRLPREGDDVRVMLRYPEEARTSLESLRNFRVRTSDGREIPLLSIAEIEIAPGISRINRREGQRSARVGAELKGDVRRDILNDLNENFFPEWEKRYPGVSRGALGSAEGEQQFISELTGLYFLAILAMYALVAIAFRSYFLPIVIVLSAIPFGFVGAVYGHMLFGISFAMFSFLGIGAAAGVVINDNLVLVDQIQRMRREGTSVNEALVEAGVRRFRPILLTSVTTFIGLMPMMAERSTQAEFLKPMVVALAFGVALATFVTLFLVPALYRIGVDISWFLGKIGWAYGDALGLGGKEDTRGLPGRGSKAPAE